MTKSILSSRLFDVNSYSDQATLDKLWYGYGDFFSLKEEQSDYYNNGFLPELQEIKSANCPGKRVYLFTNNAQPVSTVGMGMLCDTDESRVCEIKKVYVSNEHQGNGYGYAAVSGVIEQAKKHGFEKCRLDVLTTESKSAFNIYKKLGFKVVKTTSFKADNDVAWMEKDLTEL